MCMEVESIRHIYYLIYSLYEYAKDPNVHSALKIKQIQTSTLKSCLNILF